MDQALKKDIVSVYEKNKLEIESMKKSLEKHRKELIEAHEKELGLIAENLAFLDAKLKHAEGNLAELKAEITVEK